MINSSLLTSFIAVFIVVLSFSLMLGFRTNIIGNIEFIVTTLQQTASTQSASLSNFIS